MNNYINKLITGNLLYYDKKILSVNVKDSSVENQAGQNKKNGLIILGRSHYFETVKTFPFDNIRDIRNAISFDIGAYSPFKTELFFLKKIDESGGKTRVNIWFVKQEVAELLKLYTPRFIIPETYLFSYTSKKKESKLVINKENGEQLFVSAEDDIVRSLISNIELNAFIGFCRSVGSSSMDKVDIKSSEIVNLFEDVIHSMTFSDFIVFIIKDMISFEGIIKQSKILISILTIVYIVYLGSYSYFVSTTLDRLKTEDNSISTRITELIENRDKIRKDLAIQNELIRLFNDYTGKFELLERLDNLIPISADIDSLSIKDRNGEISGSATNAVDLINILTNNKMLTAVKFISPLQKDKKTGNERFRISFIIKDDD